jgi:hypothetical protein
MWDEVDEIGLAATKATADHAINQASAADLATFNGIAADVRTKVIAEITAEGIDAQTAYDMIASEMANY